MKGPMNYYKHYEKLVKMPLGQSIVATSEYHSFSEAYPRITESIRLKRELERLTNKLKSEEAGSAKFKTKREIAITKTKMKRNNLFKRLDGESKQEAIFQRKLKLRTMKMCGSLLVKRFRKRLGRPNKNFKRTLRRSLHRNLPPSLFNLRELDVTERGLALREWLQENRKKLN